MTENDNIRAAMRKFYTRQLELFEESLALLQDTLHELRVNRCLFDLQECVESQIATTRDKMDDARKLLAKVDSELYTKSALCQD